jgi:ribosomal protein S18 acetylase RimI-like enzyme
MNVLRACARLGARTLCDTSLETPEAENASAERLFGRFCELHARKRPEINNRAALVIARGKDSSLVGMCTVVDGRLPCDVCKPPEGMEKQPIARLTFLAVDPSARMQGIATRILDKCEETARGWGKREAWLCVEPTNAIVLSLCAKRGYKSVLLDQGVRTPVPDQYGEMQDVPRPVVLMRKNLGARRWG